MERSKKYASYTDAQIIELSSADLPLRSKSYLAIELELRGLKKHAKNKSFKMELIFRANLQPLIAP
jgi:hypothetical protein